MSMRDILADEQLVRQLQAITSKEAAWPYDAATAAHITPDVFRACIECGTVDGERMDKATRRGVVQATKLFANAGAHFYTVYQAMLEGEIRSSDGSKWPADAYGLPDIGSYLADTYCAGFDSNEDDENARLKVPAWHGLMLPNSGAEVISRYRAGGYVLVPYGSLNEYDRFRVLVNLCAAGYERPIRDLLRGERKTLPHLGYMPNASEVQTLTKVLATGGRPHNSAVTRSEKWSIEEKRDGDDVLSLVFTRTNRSERHRIEIKNAGMLFPGETSDRRKRGTIVTRKLLPFVLQKMVQQGYPEQVAIDLEEMVTLEMYANTDSAYRALSRFMQQMAEVDISYSSRVKGKPRTGGGGVIFYHRVRKGSMAYVFVNQNIDYVSFLARQWTVFPRWAYALDAGAFDLVRYVFYIARQRAREIALTGRFTIGLTTVCENMGLPSPEEVTGRKYREKIRKPIEDAIEQIEERVAKVPEAKGSFFITPHTDETTTSIDAWLQGHLEIELADEYRKAFEDVSQRQNASFERVQKRKKQLEEKNK